MGSNRKVKTHIMDKERNDNSLNFKGLHFQLAAALYYISVKQNIKYKKIIEHKGDITFDDKIQIEAKHKKSCTTLGDNSIDFWNTLNNLNYY